MREQTADSIASRAETSKRAEAWPGPSGGLVWLVAALGLAWGGLFILLSGEWEANPQYGYGWFVPLLAAGVFWNRWRTRPPATAPVGVARMLLWIVLAGLLAVLGLVVFVAEANPEWRLLLWVAALLVAALSALLVALGGGVRLLNHLAFALVFPLVAVPWPSAWESGMIQGLTAWAARFTAMVLQAMGIPAVCHGNVIELATGVVGVDDACSGIRSFQSGLLAGLFLGEFYGLGRWWRLVVCLAGLALSYALNLVRMLFLSLAAAQSGPEAVGRWHDPAGVTIQLATFALVWLGCAGLARATGAGLAIDRPPGDAVGWPPAAARAAAVAVVALLLARGGAEWWFRSHEVLRPPVAAWSVPSAEEKGAGEDEELSETAKSYLRYSEGFQRRWADADGRTWHLIYLRWDPGRVAMHLARNHTPEVCQRALGREVVSISDEHRIELHGIPLSYRFYSVNAGGQPLHVLYILSDDRMDGEGVRTQSLTWEARLRPVLEGRRNTGQRSLQIAVVNVADPAEAEKLVLAKLPGLVRRED